MDTFGNGGIVLPGQYFDAETGLHYNYFRDYNPKTGKYIQPDPIGLAGGMNPFVYAGNNPLRFSDYFGLHYLIDPFTGGYKPHRHDKNGMIDPFRGQGCLIQIRKIQITTVGGTASSAMVLP